LNGAVGNVVTLNYSIGSSLTQQVTVVGIKDGLGKLSATGGGFSAGAATFNVWAEPGSKLIGHWLNGAANLSDTSGFRPAGTHDGIAVGANAGLLAFSPDVPTGYTGQSLDLTAGNVAVMITNSSSIDPNYVETFDDQIAKKFSITFWAKGAFSGDWNPWISKRGEDSWGYQVRRYSGDNPVRPTFTLRGTPGADDPYLGTTVDNDTWHHWAATWDGTTGIRQLYLDGKPIMTLSGDTGPAGLASANHLMIGGRDNGGFGNFFPGYIFDVRMFSYALDALSISAMVNPPTAFTLSLSPLVAPQNETLRLAVTLPASATASSAVTVYLTNNSPTVVSFVGFTGNVFPLTFPIGSTIQGVDLKTIGAGQINITAGAAGQGSTALTTINTVVTAKLIGQWFSGAADLADKSGNVPNGVHDGVVVGISPETLAFSTDVPTGFSGQSLDLTANAGGTTSVGVIVTNSAVGDGAYLPTFDDSMAATFSVALWSKGVPGTWAGFVNKRGEDGIGWQMRRSGGDTEAFTIRGTASGNADGVGSVVITDGSQWHHYAGVWDGITGTRKCYVDGVLDPSVDLIGDFAPMSMAPNHHVGIGTREQNSPGGYESWFNGKLYDVRIYNYPIGAGEVAALAGRSGPPPTLTVQRWTGNQIRISWPTSFAGYVISQSSTVTGGWTNSGLLVTVEGSENVAYAPASASPQFFRLKK